MQGTEKSAGGSCCHPKKKRDLLLFASAIIIITAYSFHVLFPAELSPLSATFTGSVFELMNKMWWGVLLGIFSVGLLGTVPRELVVSILGKGGTFTGILRATAAGVLLDLCSHGILLVGMKLYERGASLGQIMAFLIASPWNSLSLTLILWALVGFQWMISFLLLSLVIALISGVIFDHLVKRGTLPSNPNHIALPENFSFFKAARDHWRSVDTSLSSFGRVLLAGFRDSSMILKWIFFGVVLAAAIRTFMPPESFATFFGPTVAGLGLTLVVATILEVCSEGSMPVAADLLTRASAPGNAFAFLMTGIATDYTEILSIRETTKSWKIAFFLPLITVPQVVLIALLLNQVTL